MKCENCGKNLKIPNKVYMHLETYNSGGTDLIASECCNTPYLVKMNVTYSLTKYTGDRKEDDWGKEFSQNKKD